MLKRIVSIFVALLVVIFSSVSFLVNALESSYFSFSYNSSMSVYDVTFNSSANFSNIKEVEIPSTYNNLTNGEHSTRFSSASISNSTIKRILIPGNVSSLSISAFSGLSVLEEVEYTFTGELTIPAATFMNCSSLKKIYIYANSINITAPRGMAFMGFISNSDSKIYVTSETVKNQIVSGTSASPAPVQASQIEVMQSDLKDSSLEISCANITYGTEGGLKPNVVKKTGDGAVTYQLFSDQACQTQYTGYPYNSASLPVGTYYLRGSMAATSNYKGCVSNIVKVEVTKNSISDEVKKTLTDEIEKANNFKNENVEGDYVSAAWNAVYRANTGALAEAERVAKNIESGTYTEAQITAATTTLKNALEALKTSVIDPVEEKAALEKVIEEAEGIDANKYTDESYQKLKDEIQEAKQIIADTKATKTQVENAAKAIEKAKESLEIKQDIIVPAGKPFVKVYAGGKTATIVKVNADEKMNGASKVRITFDCAEDVSFNPNATLELESIVAGKKSYQKVAGTDGSYTVGKTDCTIDFSFNAVVKKGDSVELSGFTYSWANAKDYVYGITKVEFMNEEGKIIKAYTDETLAQENLEKAITEAESLDASKYTAESFKAVTAALEAAKKLGKDAAVEAKNEAAAAIEAAVKALVKKPTEQPSATASEKKPTATKQPVSTTRNADDVKKDKAVAKKAMKQAKITKLKVNSKAKKKINVSWKKVKKAKGYQVQVSAKKNFKKIIFRKDLKKTKLTIKNKKIKSKKTYYVRVRAYATYKDKNNKAVKVYSKWNKALRKVTVK